VVDENKLPIGMIERSSAQPWRADEIEDESRGGSGPGDPFHLGPAGTAGSVLLDRSTGRPLIPVHTEGIMRNTMEREKDLQFHDVAP
jgi:hypothetical protein